MTDKCSQWQQLLADCAQSGGSVQRWCSDHDIPLHRYYYWRRRLSATVEPGDGVVEWLDLPSDASPKLTLRVGSATIEVSAGFDAALLRAVVAALEASPC